MVGQVLCWLSPSLRPLIRHLYFQFSRRHGGMDPVEHSSCFRPDALSRWLYHRGTSWLSLVLSQFAHCYVCLQKVGPFCSSWWVHWAFHSAYSVGHWAGFGGALCPHSRGKTGGSTGFDKFLALSSVALSTGAGVINWPSSACGESGVARTYLSSPYDWSSVLLLPTRPSHPVECWISPGSSVVARVSVILACQLPRTLSLLPMLLVLWFSEPFLVELGSRVNSSSR